MKHETHTQKTLLPRTKKMQKKCIGRFAIVTRLFLSTVFFFFFLARKSSGFGITNTNYKKKKVFIPSSTSTTSSLMMKMSQQVEQEQQTKFISGLSEVVDSHDVFLLDMWGVMHDGIQPYEHVLNTITNLVGQADNNKKELIILSNSSKRMQNSIKMLTKLGFLNSNEQQLQEGSTKIEPFTKIITSGEVSWQMLSGTISDKQNWSVIVDLLSREKKNEEEGEKKQLLKAFVLGSGSQDEEYITSAGWSVTPFIEEADLIVARGPFTIYTPLDSDNSSSSEMKVISKNDKDGEEKYNQILELNLRKAAQLKKPMLITNPDKVRPDADLSPMPGYIGDLYQEMLNELYYGSEKEQQGLIKRIGKPFSDVYEIALSNSSTSDKDKALMVGDALETDITGGYFAGIHTCLVVKDGVHAAAVKEKENEFEESVTEVIESFHDNIQNTYAGELKSDESDSDDVLPSPTFVVPHFQW